MPAPAPEPAPAKPAADHRIVQGNTAGKAVCSLFVLPSRKLDVPLAIPGIRQVLIKCNRVCVLRGGLFDATLVVQRFGERKPRETMLWQALNGAFQRCDTTFLLSLFA